MSADGEIEVKVNAEGTDEAAQELSEGDGGGGGLGGGGAGGAGGMAGKLGMIGAALGVIIGLLSALPGMVQFLKGFFEIAQAYLAPVSVMLMRLLAPVMRMLIQFLPTWMNWMDVVAKNLEYLALLFGFIGIVALLLDKLPGNIWSQMATWAGRIAGFLMNLPGNIWSAIVGGAAWLGNSLATIATSIGRSVWSFMSQLPALIGREIAQRVPSVPSGGDVADAGRDLVSQGQQFVRENTQVNIEGGLGAFVETVEETSNIDIP
jgi:hypothetical protein